MGEKDKLKKEDLVDLGDAVDKLRSELIKAWQKAEQAEHQLKFNVKEIELELQTVIQDSDKVGGGIDLKVFKFGGDHTDTDSRTQTVRLKLEPDVTQSSSDDPQKNKVAISGKVEKIID